MKKLVYGVGVSEDGKYKRSFTVNGKSQKTREYELWKNMLARCYSKKMNELRPRYIGCTISENFKNFQWFAEWCNSQPGFKDNWQLEKDILYKHNKVYSENTCRFVPHTINMLLVKSEAARTTLPIGVRYNNKSGKYLAYCGNTRAEDTHGKGYIGSYHSVEAAFDAYKKKKKDLIMLEVEKFKGQIAPDVYLALQNYEVEITD